MLLLDAEHPFEKQDLQIADLIVQEGRALVIAVNKWDLVRASQARLAELEGNLRAPSAADQGCCRSSRSRRSPARESTS